MAAPLWDHVNALDTSSAAERFGSADSFPHVVIDDFLCEDFARRVAQSYPAYEEALSKGREFNALNEKRKVQVTDVGAFPEPVRTLDEILASDAFLTLMEEITGIPKLLADRRLAGGGMHLMASGSRLDVHVDFNLLEERALHRRLNILVFLNPAWNDAWGGHLELWRPGVTSRIVSLAPILNRCVVFATSDRSFHGVTKLVCPTGVTRNSFAGYYYTREAPPDWDGRSHTTVFRARPDERFRGAVLMPLERRFHDARRALRRAKQRLRRLVRH